MTAKRGSTPTSPAKVAANRRNAQRSTGPRTDEGKAHSALNATKHGILAHHVVNDKRPDDVAVFEEVYSRLIDEFAPRTVMETILVDRIFVCFWRLRRLAIAESLAITERLVKYGVKKALRARDTPIVEPTLPDFDALEIYSRYDVTLERQLYRAMDQLHALRLRRSIQGALQEKQSIPGTNERLPDEGEPLPDAISLPAPADVVPTLPEAVCDQRSLLLNEPKPVAASRPGPLVAPLAVSPVTADPSGPLGENDAPDANLRNEPKYSQASAVPPVDSVNAPLSAGGPAPPTPGPPVQLEAWPESGPRGPTST